MGYNENRARQIAEATFGRDVREPVAASCEANRDDRIERVNDVDAFHKERIYSVTTKALRGKGDYYTMVVNRVNGK